MGGAQEYRRDSFSVTTDAGRIDVDAVGALLEATYWAKGRSRELIERSIRHSLCFSLFEGDRQIGFLRVVTDYAVFAYLCDVVIDPAYRGRGLGQWLLSCVFGYPDFEALQRWCLITRDAQEFYRQSGFRQLEYPERYMEIFRPDL